MLEQKSGKIEYLFEDRQKIASFTPITETGWTIAVVADASELLALAKRIGALNLILMSVIVMLVGGAIFLIAQSITRPMLQAVGFARTLAEGISARS